MEQQNPFESPIQNQNENEVNQNQVFEPQQLAQENPQVLQTEQRAQVAVEYAGFWARFAANMIDGLVLIIPSIIVRNTYGIILGYFMSYILMWAYAIYMLTNQQATLGKMAVGLKVIKINGDYGTAQTFAMREILGKIVNIITLGVGYLMIAFTDKKQGLHDMIADTVVVFDPARKRRQWLIVSGIIIAFLYFTFTIIINNFMTPPNQRILNENIESEREAAEIIRGLESRK